MTAHVASDLRVGWVVWLALGRRRSHAVHVARIVGVSGSVAERSRRFGRNAMARCFANAAAAAGGSGAAAGRHSPMGSAGTRIVLVPRAELGAVGRGFGGGRRFAGQRRSHVRLNGRRSCGYFLNHFGRGDLSRTTAARLVLAFLLLLLLLLMLLLADVTVEKLLLALEVGAARFSRAAGSHFRHLRLDVDDDDFFTFATGVNIGHRFAGAGRCGPTVAQFVQTIQLTRVRLQ